MKLNQQKAEEITKDVLLDIMGSYLRQISRDKGEYPVAVLSDLRASMKSVLKKCNYDGKYKDELSK